MNLRARLLGVGLCVASVFPSARTAEPAPADSLPPAVQSPSPGLPGATYRLTLEEAKQRALAASKLLNLAARNAQSKAYAVKVARADYFPKVVGAALYRHFNDDLGTVERPAGPAALHDTRTCRAAPSGLAFPLRG